MWSRRTQSMPVAFLSLGLALALASVSLAYVAWGDQLNISAQIDTGSMSVAWTPDHLCGDNDGSQGYADVVTNRDAIDHSTMHFTLTNAYPGYVATCHFEWENTGTVPVRITSLHVNGTSVASHATNSFDLDGDGVFDVSIRLQNGIGSIEVPGGGGNKSIRVEVLDGAPQSTSMSFDGHVSFVIWNAP